MFKYCSMYLGIQVHYNEYVSMPPNFLEIDIYLLFLLPATEGQNHCHQEDLHLQDLIGDLVPEETAGEVDLETEVISYKFFINLKNINMFTSRVL